MKRLICLVFVLCLLLAGCGKSEPVPTVYKVNDYPLSITIGDDYQPVDAQSEWNLYLSNGKSYLGVMVYAPEEIPGSMTAREIFDIQNQDLFSRRENVKRLSGPETTQLGSKEITKSCFTATKDGSQSHYAAFLVNFGYGEHVAWVLLTSTESYWEENGTALTAAVYSLTQDN